MVNKSAIEISDALEMLESHERRDQVGDFFNHQLPRVAAELENLMCDQGARIRYEISSDQAFPQIIVTLQLKIEHEVVIHLDAPDSIFMIGSKRDGVFTNSSEHAAQITSAILGRLKV